MSKAQIIHEIGTFNIIGIEHNTTFNVQYTFNEYFEMSMKNSNDVNVDNELSNNRCNQSDKREDNCVISVSGDDQHKSDFDSSRKKLWSFNMDDKIKCFGKQNPVEPEASISNKKSMEIHRIDSIQDLKSKSKTDIESSEAKPKPVHTKMKQPMSLVPQERLMKSMMVVGSQVLSHYRAGCLVLRPMTSH